MQPSSRSGTMSVCCGAAFFTALHTTTTMSFTTQTQSSHSTTLSVACLDSGQLSIANMSLDDSKDDVTTTLRRPRPIAMTVTANGLGCCLIQACRERLGLDGIFDYLC